MKSRQRAFTLLELMVTIVVVAVVMTLAVPSFHNFILLQRLKSVNAQLVTDLQSARAESVSRAIIGRVVFGSNSTMSCYTLFVVKAGAQGQQVCDCSRGPGNACNGTADISNATTEIRTVLIPTSKGVSFQIGQNAEPLIGFDPLTGGLFSLPTDSGPQPLPSFQVDTMLDSGHLIRAMIGAAGRVQLCSLGDRYGPPAC